MLGPDKRAHATQARDWGFNEWRGRNWGGGGWGRGRKRCSGSTAGGGVGGLDDTGNG